MNGKSYSGSDELPQGVRSALLQGQGPEAVASKGISTASFLVSDGTALPDAQDLHDLLPSELKHFLSQLQGKDGKRIPDAFQGNLSDIVRALSGLSSQSRRKGLNHILQNLPQSLVPPVDSEEAQDPFDLSRMRSLASGAPSERAQEEEGARAFFLREASRNSHAPLPMDPLNASRPGDCLRILFLIVALAGLAAFFWSN